MCVYIARKIAVYVTWCLEMWVCAHVATDFCVLCVISFLYLRSSLSSLSHLVQRYGRNVGFTRETLV